MRCSNEAGTQVFELLRVLPKRICGLIVAKCGGAVTTLLVRSRTRNSAPQPGAREAAPVLENPQCSKQRRKAVQSAGQLTFFIIHISLNIRGNVNSQALLFLHRGDIVAPRESFQQKRGAQGFEVLTPISPP